MGELEITMQIIYIYIYILEVFLIGGSIAVLLFQNEKVKMRKCSVICFSYASVPFVLGIYTLITSVIPITLPQILYWCTPIVVCFIFLWKNKTILTNTLQNIKLPSIVLEYWEGILMCLVLLNATLFFVQIDFMLEKPIQFYGLWMLIQSLFYSVLVRCTQSWISRQREEYNIQVIQYQKIFFLGLFIWNYMLLFLLKGVRILLIGQSRKLVDIIIGFAAIIAGTIILRIFLNNKYKQKEYKYIITCFIYIGILTVLLLNILLFDRLKIRLLITFAILGIILTILFFLKFSNNTVLPMLIQCMKIISFFSCIYFIVTILQGSLSPVFGSDASEYLSNALNFTQTMQFKDINNFKGAADGSLLAIVHNPVWVTYLGNALLHTPAGLVGYPNDFVARFAIQINIIYMSFASIGIVLLLKRTKFSLLAATLPLIYINMSIMYGSHSRDAFRIIPLLLMCGFLLEIKEIYMMNERLPKIYYWIGAFIAATILMGHPINIMQAGAIAIAFLIWLGCNKAIRKDIFKLISACIVGAALGAYQIIWALLTTGKATGNLVDIDELLLNTDYYTNYMDYTKGRLLGTQTYLERIGEIFQRDYGLLTVVALVIAISYIIISLIKKKEKGSMFFLSLIIIFQSVVFVDIIKWSGIAMSEWCVMNMRYTLQMYVFYGIYIAVFIGTMKIKSNLVAIVLCLYISIPIFNIGVNWMEKNQFWKMNPLLQEYSIFDTEVVKYALGNRRVLIDNYYCNYYLDNKALSIFTEPAKNIRKSQTEEELEAELKRSNIGAILIMDSFRDVYWKNTLLETFTEEDDYVEKIVKCKKFKIYLLK